MPRTLARIVARIRNLATHGRLRFTAKAFRELGTLELPLDEDDARHVIAGLRVADLAARVASNRTGEWMYVFKPRVGGVVLYIKIVLRLECVVVSFHEEEDGDGSTNDT